MKKTVVLVFGLLVFLAVNCAAQARAGDQRFVGTWINTPSDGREPFTVTITLNADGSGAWTLTTSMGVPQGSPAGGTFFYGISDTGEMTATAYDLPRSLNGKYYFSPDGTMFILNNAIYRKQK